MANRKIVENETDISSISDIQLNGKPQQTIINSIKALDLSHTGNLNNDDIPDNDLLTETQNSQPHLASVVASLRNNLQKKFLVSPGLFEGKATTIATFNKMNYEQLKAADEMSRIRVGASQCNAFTIKALGFGSSIIGTVFGMSEELNEEINADIELQELSKQYMVDMLLWIPDIMKLGMMFMGDVANAYVRSQYNKKLKIPNRDNMTKTVLKKYDLNNKDNKDNIELSAETINNISSFQPKFKTKKSIPFEVKND